MTAQILDGKAIAAAHRDQTKADAAAFAGRFGRPPHLLVIIVGEHAPSQVYVRNKAAAARKTDVSSDIIRLPADASQADVERAVADAAQDPGVDGILLQLPLPGGLDAARALDGVPPEKDVDGLTTLSQGRLAMGVEGLRPCTPLGARILAQQARPDLTGAHVVVLGRSTLVGKPAAQLFLEANCTVTMAHSRSRDIAALCHTADILIAAVGRPGLVKADWIRPGAIVIDVGINRVADPAKGPGAYRLVGDVDFDAAKDVASAITPVPGGVGPMTIACLLSNTVAAATLRATARPENAPV